MKKSLLACAASLALAATPVLGAYAIDSQSHDVTVGDVDETVYSVDINWGDLSFDWKYDEETNSFDFEAPLGCISTEGLPYWSGMDSTQFLQDAHGLALVFADENCTTPYYGDLSSGTTYMKIHPKNRIIVLDYSTNGSVSATMSFAAESNYDWVEGKTAFNYAVSPSGKVHFINNPSEASEDEIYPGFGAGSTGPDAPLIPLSTLFYIKKAANTDTSTKTINANDKIGTITINITPNE